MVNNYECITNSSKLGVNSAWTTVTVFPRHWKSSASFLNGKLFLLLIKTPAPTPSSLRDPSVKILTSWLVSTLCSNHCCLTGMTNFTFVIPNDRHLGMESEGINACGITDVRDWKISLWPCTCLLSHRLLRMSLWHVDMAVDCITMCCGIMSSKRSRAAVEVVEKQFKNYSECAFPLDYPRIDFGHLYIICCNLWFE